MLKLQQTAAKPHKAKFAISITEVGLETYIAGNFEIFFQVVQFK
jgi:hypothetical protein